MPGMGKAPSAALTRTLCNRLREHVFLTRQQLNLQISGSFGLATCPDDGDTVHAMLRSADSMMYEVKNTTRNDVAVMGMELRHV
jgi:GGDEF domain-containing protein